ncbi:hypothetical protein AB0M43_32070 [Longispora sp. NPDC051575]|uniref:hypothetical protein n=1 Tax=Longispora sp. NPDC051575 TaxID=3154943 RepID=UPI00344A2780
MRLGRSIALSSAVLALTAACAAGPADSGASPTAPTPTETATPVAVILPDAPNKLSGADLLARWWNWVASSAEDPRADVDGHLCARGQATDIWFLAGGTDGTATRSCTVPAGVPVAFPVVHRSGLQSGCEDFMKVAKGRATLDGFLALPDRHDPVNVQIKGVAGNPVTKEAGRTLFTSACGLWVQLAPLEPGSHTLSVVGDSGTYKVAVTYKLQVAAS